MATTAEPSQVTCGLYGIIDVLHVRFDANRQRLTDKILKFPAFTRS